jgi:uncharacterized integral membrane protein (TIGR00698 family)
MGAMSRVFRLLPGLLLCLAVTGAAELLQGIEVRLWGRAWLEGLVIAILLGALVRTLWTPGEAWRAGVEFSAKQVLEIAVALLGAGATAATLLAAGVPLLIGIAALVVVAILISFALGRMAGLPPRMATLIACGNAICGNSAIAAVAPVIGADGEDVAAAIAFTAVLGVGVVVGLPFLAGALAWSPRGFGAFAGLTVYAVPQVIAATAAVGGIAVHLGTLVKLVRVLMLGPVVLALSVIAARWREAPDEAAPEITAGDRPKPGRPALHHLVPWFILAFLAMVAARSLGLIPAVALPPLANAATALTIVSMAALGLGVDVRILAKAGPRITAVVTLSLAVLGALTFGLLKGLGFL